jgi:phosphoribosyl-ATP pyrophosphohydrolase/phosphoribosyl-AMP cyclohydrolase
MNLDNIDWDKVNGLVPAIVQDFKSSQVLMLGYMNKEALENTINTNFVHFYSRTKKRLWKKGETSGNVLLLNDIQLDCDRDTLLIKASNKGPTCHLGQFSCFGEEEFNISKLEKIIESRLDNPSEESYTSSLFKKGIKEIAKKVTEEAGEVSISAVSNDGRVIEESADLLFHLLVLLKNQNISIENIIEELEKRSG